MSTISVHSRADGPMRALSYGIANIRFIEVKKKRCSLKSSYKLCNTFKQNRNVYNALNLSNQISILKQNQKKKKNNKN